MNTKSLLCIFLSMSILVSTTIFYSTYGFITVQLGHSNESGKNYISQRAGQSKMIVTSVAESPKLDPNETVSQGNAKGFFSFYDNQSRMTNFDLSSFWIDANFSCNSSFKCIPSFSTGWKDYTSLKVSTMNNNNNTWSSINGTEAEVKSGEHYKLVTHMKLNKYATQSHVLLEGFNESSKRWYQITQCPSGTDGPLKWKEFNCNTQIPVNTSKVKPVLNAGWSSKPNKEAVTWFDSRHMINFSGISIVDPNLEAQVVYQGLERPTSMAFLGPNDILVSEGVEGTIQRILNGEKLGKPLVDLDAVPLEGLIGIAIEKNASMSKTGLNKQTTNVFVHIVDDKREGDDLIGGNGSVGNRLYKYEFVNDALVNPKLLLELPAGSEHNGGPILVGPENFIYLSVGELTNDSTLSHERNMALNYEGKDAQEPDGRGGILRIDQNGNVSDNHGILGDKEPLNKYYAYGIRNSFGMDFDPITGKLWDTENGPHWGDEINLVEPGFNSGWGKVQGIWNVLDRKTQAEEEIQGDLASINPGNLVDFEGKGKYSPPEFTWNRTVGPTAIKFITTDKLGKKYENDIFVADVNNARIYHFELNKNRTALQFQGPLIDRVADSDRELDNVIFAKNFGSRISDLDIGPDGYLYVLLIDSGTIYRIVPSHLYNATDSLG